MSDIEEQQGTSSSAYTKLRPDGTIDPKPVSQSDYDTVNSYIKEVFPKATRVQREIEQTLKRTFVLGRTEKPKVKLNMSKSSLNAHGPGVLSRRVRLKLKKEIPKKLHYADFLPLNSLWKSYISDLLKDEKEVADIQGRINKSDFHGALITVQNADCKAYVGLTGIILKETRNTFVVVSPSNVTKTIPKAETCFTIELEEPKGVVQLAGNSFIIRPGERTNKKVKGFMEFMSAKVYKSRLKDTHKQN